MKVSVVIPTFNRGEALSTTVLALKRQSLKDYELVVVVDGSSDNTLEILNNFRSELPNLKVINQKNRGRSASRNRGAMESTGDLLVFFDDDMEPEEDTLEKHLKFHLAYPMAVLVGNHIERDTDQESDFQKFKVFLSKKWTKELGSSLNILKHPYISAANFSIRKEVFQSLNGFNEKLTDAEDKELAERVFKKGIEIYFDPENFAWHNEKVTCEKYIKRSKQYRKASQKLYELFPTKFPELKSFKEPSLLTKAKFLPFSFPFWVRLIDAGFFIFLPKKVRYKLYDFVITSQGYVFNK